jgi:putative NIF3 family GTP cyclohydrolase 1 type 2
VPLSEVVVRVKERLKLKHLRLACPSGAEKGEDPIIKTTVACAGAGGGVLEGGQADLLLTGEMSHHQVLEATSCGSAVILCEHSNSERGFIQTKYKQLLEQALQGVEVSIATTDRDPLEVV